MRSIHVVKCAVFRCGSASSRRRQHPTALRHGPAQRVASGAGRVRVQRISPSTRRGSPDAEFRVTTNNRYPDLSRHPHIGRTFGDAGYRCGYIGKWHLGEEVRLDAGHAMRLGFDDEWFVPLKGRHNNPNRDHAINSRETEVGEGLDRTEAETNRAIDFINRTRGFGWSRLLCRIPGRGTYSGVCVSDDASWLCAVARAVDPVRSEERPV